MGEALRALDQKDIIKGDFILVSGDTVANVDLGPALAAHRARREKDKNAIMTMVRAVVCYAMIVFFRRCVCDLGPALAAQ